MKTQFLLPHSYKRIGWLMLATALIGTLLVELFGAIPLFTSFTLPALIDSTTIESFRILHLIEDDIHFELFCVLVIIGCLFVAFARLKTEDEYTSKIRLESLVWATYVHFGFVLLSSLFVYGLLYLNVLLINTFTILFLFIIRFEYCLHKSKRQLRNEE
jgi:hypothetical protein